LSFHCTNREREIAVRKILARLARLGIALAAMAAVLFAAPAAHAAAAPGEVSAYDVINIRESEHRDVPE
jgi:hypothetical protein